MTCATVIQWNERQTQNRTRRPQLISRLYVQVRSSSPTSGLWVHRDCELRIHTDHNSCLGFDRHLQVNATIERVILTHSPRRLLYIVENKISNFARLCGFDHYLILAMSPRGDTKLSRERRNMWGKHSRTLRSEERTLIATQSTPTQATFINESFTILAGDSAIPKRGNLDT
jgi:hypothetical protein